MTITEIFILAILQGLTEFLPVSSSAHLILPSAVLGWKDQGIGLDVALHVGTLLAVVLYFRKDVANMAVAWVGSITGDNTSFDGKLAWWILFATIPLGLFGYFGNDFVSEHLRTAAVISATTLIFGFFLGYADIKANKRKPSEHADFEKLGFKGAMLIGFAQALALIPGTSRSGITMTIGLMLGLSRENAARFSFLLSIPAIAMAGSYLTFKLITESGPVDWNAIGLGSVLAFFSAYACIHYFLILLEKVGMMPFVIYRLVLGVALLWFVLG